MAFSLLNKLRFKDLVTLVNLSLGLLALLSAHRLSYDAGLFVLAAILVDALDGKIARSSKGGPNAFGKELDSLADMASFGVAPAFLILANRFDELSVIVALFYASMAAVRLAHFNLQKEKGVYRGLPSPAAAFLVLVGLYFVGDAIVIPLISALLMVADVKFGKPRILV